MSVLRSIAKSLALAAPSIRRLHDSRFEAKTRLQSLIQSGGFDEYQPTLHLFADNQRLSDSQVTTAKAIGEDGLKMVEDRDRGAGSGTLDARFALPDANWSIDAPNEYLSLFRRVAQCDRLDLEHFRGLTAIFSGYNLFEVRGAAGLTASALTFDDDFSLTVAERLSKRNRPFVEEWRRVTKGLPRKFIFSPPAMLGEVGHSIGGVIVNSDTCTYQERVNLLVRSGLLDWLRSRIEAVGEVTICEIGGGYGALCHWFKEALPEASYTIVDLPESILFSRMYMTLTRPDLRVGCGLKQVKFGVRFVPNHLAESLDEDFDLIINTLSLSEMSEYQVHKYIEIMKKSWLRNGGILFEQNQDNRHLGYLFAQEIIGTEFPFRVKLSDGIERLRNGYPNAWSMRSISDEVHAADNAGG
jgi:hypothetical protein